MKFLTSLFIAAASAGGSSSLAESKGVEVTLGYNLLVNTVANGSNTLGEILPDVPDGTLVFTWPSNSPGYAGASQFVRRADGRREWSRPDLRWEPWEVAAVLVSAAQSAHLDFVGVEVGNPGPIPAAKTFGPVPVSRLPALDYMSERELQVLPILYRMVNGSFKLVSEFSFGEWNPPLPEFRPNEAVAFGLVPRPIVYFGNYVHANGVLDPWINPFTGSPFDHHWSARLMRHNGSAFEPIGSSVPFIAGENGLALAAAGGVLNVSEDLLRQVPPGWSTFRIDFSSNTTPNECFGSSAPFDLNVSAGVPAGLPPVDLPLTISYGFITHPVSASLAIGSAAQFSASVAIGANLDLGPVDWEKRGADGKWEQFRESPARDSNSPDAELRFPNVTWVDAGFYRARIRRGCVDLVSTPAELTVFQPQAELTLHIHRAVELEFSTISGARYQIERSGDLSTWLPHGDVILGTGAAAISFQTTRDAPRTMHYRVRRL